MGLTPRSDRLDSIVLSGGTSQVEGFAEALSERLEVEVERFDPFRSVAFDAGTVSSDEESELRPSAAVAVGLALRRAHDR